MQFIYQHIYRKLQLLYVPLRGIYSVQGKRGNTDCCMDNYSLRRNSRQVIMRVGNWKALWTILCRSH